MNYARGTQVSQDRSRAEIERLLMRYGADEFAYMTRRDEALIGFVYKGVRVQMSVPMPDRDDEQFRLTPGRGHERSDHAAFLEWEKEARRRWRSLCLVIKALLIGVEDGVLTFEQAFLPYIVWGNGLTTSDMLLPHVQHALESGTMPQSLKLLPSLAEAAKDAP